MDSRLSKTIRAACISILTPLHPEAARLFREALKKEGHLPRKLSHALSHNPSLRYVRAPLEWWMVAFWAVAAWACGLKPGSDFCVERLNKRWMLRYRNHPNLVKLANVVERAIFRISVALAAPRPLPLELLEMEVMRAQDIIRNIPLRCSLHHSPQAATVVAGGDDQFLYLLTVYRCGCSRVTPMRWSEEVLVA